MSKNKKQGNHTPPTHSDWIAFKDLVKAAYSISSEYERLTGNRVPSGGGAVKCHVHEDKKPSMSIKDMQGGGFFYCHAASCGTSGDVFSLHMELSGRSFFEVLMDLAERAGIEPPSGDLKARISSPGKVLPPRDPDAALLGAVLKFDRPAPDIPEIFPDSMSIPQTGSWMPWVSDKPPKDGEPSKSLRWCKPEMIHVYRTADGDPFMLVQRSRTRDGGKYFIPLTLSEISGPVHGADVSRARIPGIKDRDMIWLGRIPDHRPIYGLEDVRASIHAAQEANEKPVILFVEGEKTRDAAKRLLRDKPWICPVSTIGGGGSVLSSDLRPLGDVLEELDVTPDFSIWPDADETKTRIATGEKLPDPRDMFAKKLSVALIRDVGLRMHGAHISQVMNPEKGDGWDIADGEVEGWTSSDICQSILNARPVDQDLVQKLLNARIGATGEVAPPDPFDQDPFGNLESGPLDRVDFDFATETGFEVNMETAVDTNNEVAADPWEDFRDTGSSNDDLTIVTGGTQEIEDRNENPIWGHRADRLSDCVPEIQLNPFFRPLGYREQNGLRFYFYVYSSGCVQEISRASMTRISILAMAPTYFWEHAYNLPVVENRRGGNPPARSVDWDKAFSGLMQACYEEGVWNDARETGVGAFIDNKNIVFNSGQSIWDSVTNHTYGFDQWTSERGSDCENFYRKSHHKIEPDFISPLSPNDENLRELKRVLSNLHWNGVSPGISVMSLFGFMAVSPICGVLSFRPHIALSGESQSGKTWVTQNIVGRVLGEFCLPVSSRTTESGIRNDLGKNALPVLFDEGEGEDEKSSSRMSFIIQMTRDAADYGRKRVVQGVMGGGGSTSFILRSCFMISSITPQLSSEADRSRFASLSLKAVKDTRHFIDNIQKPLNEILTPEFSRKWIGRSVMRAKDMPEICRVATEAFASMESTQRFSDLYGTLAAGAWIMMKDGVPENTDEFLDWICEEFDALQDLSDLDLETNGENDAVKMMRKIMTSEKRIDTSNHGSRTFSIYDLIERAVDSSESDVLSRKDADRELSAFGIRLGSSEGTLYDLASDSLPEGLLFHKYAPPIQEVLAKTPWYKSYAEVLIQMKGSIGSVKTTNFRGSGACRPVFVPLSSVLGGQER